MAPVINGRNLYKNILNNKIMKKWVVDDPTTAAAKLALWSTITKDALGCGIYTYQSYNNKDIPDDKRLFVASNDLSNGFYNVLIPLVLGDRIVDAGDKTFNKKFAKLFNEASAIDIHKKLQSVGLDCNLDQVKNTLDKKCKPLAKGGMKVIFALIFSQILCKRIITPLLATPSADYVKKGILKYQEKKAEKNSVNFKSSEVEKKEDNKQDTNRVESTSMTNSEVFSDFQNLVNQPPKFMKTV